MVLTINTNLSSLMAQLSMKKSTNALNSAIEKMTTGYRINSAGDDAAGYAIASKMEVDLSSYNVAQNNAMLGTSLLSTASSSLDRITTHLQRMRDLAEQAANETYGDDSIKAIQAEINQRTEEINRVMSSTEYNGIKLFEGDGTANITGEFISQVNQLTEEQALAQGYTLIKTADDLDNIRNNLSGKYILMNDIDLSSYSNWQPIGSDTNIFTGEFNGNGHVISNLKINNSTGQGVALFSYVSGIIKNVGVENAYINAEIGVGILAVACMGGTIQNSYTTGTIQNNLLTMVGGLCAMAGMGATIENVYSTADIKGSANGSGYSGGLIGIVETLTLKNSFATGNVTGYVYVGGLIGGGQNATISNSYATGDVHGDQYVGGCFGMGFNSQIDSLYSTGRVSGNSNIAGFSGAYSGTIVNSYYDTITSGQSVGISDNRGSDNVSGVQSSQLNNLIANGTLPKYTPTNAGGSSGRTFTLQIGIDSTENSQISFDTALGFTLNIDVSTTANARNALDEIDEVLNSITAKQTEFGAVQNRLDSVLNSLNVSIDNTTSSLSTIRDADIAKVSADYIRAQILQQASTSLLATANQAPSIALNLI